MTFEEWVGGYFGKDVDFPEACRDAWNAAQSAEREACIAAVRGVMVTDHGLNTWKRCVSALDKRSNQILPPSADPQQDADRYRWLSARLLGADTNWSETGAFALVFEMPKAARVSAHCDKTIDDAMALTTLTPNV